MKLNTKDINQYTEDLYKLQDLIIDVLVLQGYNVPFYSKPLKFGDVQNAVYVRSGRSNRKHNVGNLIKYLNQIKNTLGYNKNGYELISAVELRLLKLIFPNNEISEIYAIHLIYSYIKNEYWSKIPNKDLDCNYYKDYLTIYHNQIKPNLTGLIIEMLNQVQSIQDIMVYKNIEYDMLNLFKDN